jgi:hypothetical protein
MASAVPAEERLQTAKAWRVRMDKSSSFSLHALWMLHLLLIIRVCGATAFGAIRFAYRCFCARSSALKQPLYTP